MIDDKDETPENKKEIKVIAVNDVGAMNFHLEDNEVSSLPFNVTKINSKWIAEMNLNIKKFK